MLGKYHFRRQQTATKRGDSAEAVAFDSVRLKAFNEPVHGAVRQLLEEKLLAVGVGEVVESYMYFVYTADRDYVVYQLGGLSCL